jgi:hypothetical protein
MERLGQDVRRCSRLLSTGISMNIKIAALIFTAFVASTVVADDTPPTFPLSKAAKLAEDAITSASLPADCFLRSLTLIQSPDAASYYRATYKPTASRRIQVGTDPGPVTLDVIHITMDGKVSFEHETFPVRQRSQTQPAK